MKPLFSECTVKVTTDQISEINELVKKGTAMAVISAGEKYNKCPVCKEVLLREANYCHACGQKVDQDNIAL